jgi:hypothetical protein
MRRIAGASGSATLVVMSHGEVVERGGRALLQRAFAFLPR